MAKFLVTMVVVIFSSVLINSSVYAQAEKDSTVKIKTSAQCEMCKKAIEKAVNKLSGIKSADLSVETKELTVTFETEKTNSDEIRTAVTRTGYDADNMPAEKRAYNKLPKCCRKQEEK